jgi:formaldehyde-activating enzyme involved in methanogenesis
MPRKSFFSTQPLAPKEFATSIRAKIQFKMSVYIAVKAGHIIKAFASSLFTVRVGAFLFITVNLPNIAAKSNFRG